MRTGINYKLFEARREAGISQAAFAERIGMDRMTYGYIEGNKWNTSIQEKQLIADGLNVAVEELF